MHKKSADKSMAYATCRYFTPTSITAAQTSKATGKKARKRFMRQPLTYNELFDAYQQRSLFENLNPQTSANRAVALRKFLEANFLSFNDVVGPEMRMDFPAAVERFTSKLTAEGKSARAISNTMSLLRTWKAMVVESDTIAAQQAGEDNAFILNLKNLLREQNGALVARQAGVPLDMLRGWLLGKRPRGSNVKYITRLEKFFAIEHNFLVLLSGAKVPGTRVESVGGETKPIQYRNILGELTRVEFCIKPPSDSPLRTQWEKLLEYKTNARNIKKRTRRGKWRISPCPLLVPSESNWWSFLPVRNAGQIELREVASARIAGAKVSAYLGWLRLGPEAGGPGIPSTDVETLAWLAHPGYIEQYLDWTKARVGARNKGATQFLAFIASLVRPSTGYLWQCPELVDTLPESQQVAEWHAMCQQTFDVVQELTAAYDDELEVTRDSFEPIMHILQLNQPMDAIADMVQRMRADRPIANPRAEAIWARDIVLIKLLASNPLRLRNLAHLSWRSDNTGELHQREDESWWLKISKTKFKNAKGAAGDREHYECQVNPAAWRDIEKYLAVHRPRLLQANTDLFFLTANAGPLGRKNDGKPTPWNDLGRRVKELTSRYLYKCAGIGCHAFRHIVATSILKAPGGDFKTAALVLYDRVATVEKHYAFLTANEGGGADVDALGCLFQQNVELDKKGHLRFSLGKSCACLVRS